MMSFADDVLLLATSARGLQKKLDLLQNYSRERGLEVDLQKTQIVIFDGRHAVQKEKNRFFLRGRGGGDYSCVHRYLGVYFHCGGSFAREVELLAAAGRKAAFALDQ